MASRRASIPRPLRLRTRDLLQRVRGCRACEPALPEGARPVLQLDPAARVLIAGQAPGRRVHETGVPFQDASGKRLRQWMQVSSDTFYDPRRIAILPMGFCYPGTGRSGDAPPRPECAPLWREPLLACLPRLELTLVLGRYAIASHLGSSAASRPLTETVRRWRDYWPELLPLPHPSPRNNPWLRQNPWFAEELLPALRARLGELGLAEADPPPG
jgi:uracil-DNA glycosylase